MKLIMIMSVSEQSGKLHELLVKRGVTAFSRIEMEGVKSMAPVDERENWFSHDRFGASSHLILAAVDDAQASGLMKALREFSDAFTPQNPVHAFQLSVDHAV